MAKKHMSRSEKKSKFDQAYEKVLNIVLIVCGAALAAYLLWIGGNALFGALHLDGSLRTTDSAVVAEEGWLVKNIGTSSKPKCFKFGEAGEIEGYTRSVSAMSGKYDQGIGYELNEGAEGPSTIYIGVAGDIETLPETARASFASMYTNIEVSELTEGTYDGRKTVSFTYTYPDPETEETVNGLICYVQDGERSIFFSVSDKKGADINAATDKILSAIKITR